MDRDILLTMIGEAFGEGYEGMRRVGETILNRAAITTCLHGQDRYELGPFLFVCDQGSADMPHHRGAVALVGLAGASRAYICFGSNDSCIAGSVLRKHKTPRVR